MILEIVVYFLLQLVITATFLWVGMKFASFYAGMREGEQYCSYSDLLKVSAIVALVSIVPYIGWIASWAALFYMLKKVTEADPMELVIMVLVSRFAALGAVVIFFGIM